MYLNSVQRIRLHPDSCTNCLANYYFVKVSHGAVDPKLCLRHNKINLFMGGKGKKHCHTFWKSIKQSIVSFHEALPPFPLFLPSNKRGKATNAKFIRSSAKIK